MPISYNHIDLLSNLSLKNSNKLLAIKKILKYFSNSLFEKHIHILIELSKTIIILSEVLELRKQLVSLKILLNKSIYNMYYVKILGWDFSRTLAKILGYENLLISHYIIGFDFVVNPK